MGDLQEPFQVTVVGVQADLGWILLAHHAKGCLSLCQCLRQMSKIRPHHQIANRRAHPNGGPMAFSLIRVGHHRPIPNSDETTEVPNGGQRLLYQMDGS